MRPSLIAALVVLLIFALLSPEQSLAGGVVGTGTPDSCTETALDAAARGGGLVTFNCGGPATITVTAQKQVNNNMTIDGGGVITISGRNSVGFVSLGKAALTVQNLTFVDLNGIIDGSPAGALYNNSGTLTIINCTFSGNSAPIISNNAVTLTTVTTVTNSTFSGNSGGVIGNGGTLTVTNSTFSGNSGGAVYNNSGGTVTITDSTFSGNTASTGSGGAIFNGGTLTVINSTFSGNTISSYLGSGGIANSGGTLTVINSTFSGNAGSEYGPSSLGNSTTFSGTLTVTNTIVANSTKGANCSGTITDGGHNLDDGTTCGFSTANGSLNDTNPLLELAGLASNGGPTQTIALQASSPAINAGDESVCSAAPVNNLDQRGYGRPGVGETNCSIGAYEYNAQSSLGPTPTATETPVSTFSPTSTPTAVPTPTVVPCVGDCNGDGHVTVDEILTMVNIALGNAGASACPSGVAKTPVTIDQILTAVNDALNGCSGQ
jgi:hypothetical protein